MRTLATGEDEFSDLVDETTHENKVCNGCVPLLAALVIFWAGVSGLILHLLHVIS